VTSSRALSALAHGASAVFLVAEVVAWIAGLWPATPLTFTVALVVVAAGPLVGMLHVATAEEERPQARPGGARRAGASRPAAAAVPPPHPPQFRRAPEPAPALPPRLEAARRFHAWRDGHHLRA
jgi:hypothetical protein